MTQTARRSGAARVARRWGPWALLLVVAVLALGLGLRSGSRPTLEARVQHIANLVRCPVCNGETAAQSQAAPSVEIRAQIRRDLQQGENQGQILAALVRSYGQGILEKPGSNGIDVVVWVVPVIAVVAGAAGLGLALRRWKLRGDEGDEGDEGAEPDPYAADPGSEPEPAAPHAADPGSEPEPVPSPSPTSSATAVLVRSQARATPESTPPRRRAGRKSWVVVGVGSAVVAAVASYAVVSSSATRLPGQAITGQALGPAAVAHELQVAAQDASKNNPLAAIKEYQKILKSDPTEPDALTGEGWLLVQTGQPSLLRQGLGMLSKAEKSDSAYAPAHLYRGIGLLSEGDYADSVPELQWYLDHHPAQQLVAEVQKALARAKAGAAAG